MDNFNGYFYKAFGLIWNSESMKIPELPELDQEACWDDDALVTITQEDPQTWPDIPPGQYDTKFVQMHNCDLRLTVQGIGAFRIIEGKRIAWSAEHPAISHQDIRTFLLGSAIGALLIQRKILVLHGNALERDGQVVICIGHSGAGKSTVAYAMMKQGWRLLADDLVAVTPEGQVLPGIPRIKLWYDAAKAFGLDATNLTPIREGINKYLLIKK